jgi:hypothetical protein
MYQETEHIPRNPRTICYIFTRKSPNLDVCEIWSHQGKVAGLVRMRYIVTRSLKCEIFEG